MPTGTGPNDAGLSRLHILRSVEDSLRRLRTDYLDLYQVHEWDGLTPVDETLEALDQLVTSGKVRYLGASNLAAWQLMKYLGAADRAGRQRFVSQQVYYSLQARDIEYELVPLSLDQGLGVIVWGVLAGGLLTGKHRRGAAEAPGTRREGGWTEPPVTDEDKLWETVETLVALADQRGCEPAALAMAYIMQRPAVSSVLIGARTEDQLRANLAASELVLSRDECVALDHVSDYPLIYPYWHQAKNATDRLDPASLSLLGGRLR